MQAERNVQYFVFNYYENTILLQYIYTYISYNAYAVVLHIYFFAFNIC